MKAKGIVKILLSIAMLALVFRVVNFEELEHTFLNIPLRLALISIAIYSGSIVINTFKWWLIARSAGIEAHFPVAVRASFVGMFANFFGLGTLGGDVLRGVLISGAQRRKTEGIASVVADRALGLAVLALVGLCSTIFFKPNLPLPILGGLALFAAAIFCGWFAGPWLVLTYFPRKSRFRQKVEQLMQVFPRKPGMVLLLVGVSLVFHLTQISLAWYIASELGANASFTAMLAAVPFINILSTLPISWNGLGVRENAYMFFLYPAVLHQEEQVVAFGAIWLLAMTSSSLIGGLVSFVSGDFKLIAKRNGSNGESENSESALAGMRS